MASDLAALSNDLAAAVERAARSVVAVHARPRFSSSGVFWRPGIIVTAEHAIRGGDDITVTLPSGASAGATLAGRDPGTDVAVLRVESGSGEAIPHAAALPAAGNLVLSVGRSKDSGVNATMGIVSAVSGSWRTWRGGRLEHYIRLDLTLYPGSSGAVAVNIAGEAIGIATPVLSRIAGLAIPAISLDRIVDEILTRGSVRRGYLGIGLQPVELPDHQRGLIVLSVEPGGPAEQAGVLIGDVVLSLGGSPVVDTDDVQNALESKAVGDPIEVDLLRGGSLTRIAVITGERPNRG
jgi:S1-C subfamily serine protease